MWSAQLSLDFPLPFQQKVDLRRHLAGQPEVGRQALHAARPGVQAQQVESDRLERLHRVGEAGMDEVALGLVEPDLTGEIHDSHAAAPELALQRITAGERGMELEEHAIRLVGHAEMLPCCRLYRLLPPWFTFSALCPTTSPTCRRASRPRS